MAEKRKMNFAASGIGALISLIMTLILVLIISVIYYFTDIGYNICGILVFAAGAVSSFAGGMYAARKAGGNGLIHGLLTSLIYLIVLYAASFVITGCRASAARLITLLIAGSCAGMLGGIFGVN